MSERDAGPPGRAADAGWYPDPLQRFPHRYFNGERWTADVADSGNRFVDPWGTAVQPEARSAVAARDAPPRNGIAVASMVLAIAGVVVGWLPLLFVVGIVCAVLAVVFGIAGRRAARRQHGAGGGFAAAGLAIAPVAVISSAIGLVLTLVLFDRIDDYVDVGPYEASISSCAAGESAVDVAGDLTNTSTRTRSYALRVRVVRAGTDNILARHTVEIDDVAPGEQRQWRARVLATEADVMCLVADVTGPLPFGFDPNG